jgi:hypothetical protein
VAGCAREAPIVLIKPYGMYKCVQLLIFILPFRLRLVFTYMIAVLPDRRPVLIYGFVRRMNLAKPRRDPLELSPHLVDLLKVVYLSTYRGIF